MSLPISSSAAFSVIKGASGASVTNKQQQKKGVIVIVIGDTAVAGVSHYVFLQSVKELLVHVKSAGLQSLKSKTD